MVVSGSFHLGWGWGWAGDGKGCEWIGVEESGSFQSMYKKYELVTSVNITVPAVCILKKHLKCR